MKNVLIIFVALCAIPAFGQNFKPGYVLQQGDTLRGLVSFRETIAPPERCLFQKEGQPETTFYPDNLEGFGFDGRHFRTLKNKGAAHFAEVIVDGKAKFYREGSSYFVQKDTALIPLSTVTQKITVSGHEYTKEDKTYAIRLKSIFSDCSSLPSAYEQTELWTLSPSSIEKKYSKVVAKYNACFGDSSSHYTATKGKPRLSFGVLAGVISSPNSASGKNQVVHSLDSSFPVSFAAGFFVDQVNPRISDHWHVRLEAMYFRTKFTSIVATSYDPAKEIELRYTTFKFPVSVAYHFNTGRAFSPYVRGGLNFLIFTQRSFVETTDYVMGAYQSKVLDLKIKTNTFLAGVGVEYKVGRKHTLFAELRYDTGFNILSSSTNDKLKVRNIGLNAGFCF